MLVVFMTISTADLGSCSCCCKAGFLVRSRGGRIGGLIGSSLMRFTLVPRVVPIFMRGLGYWFLR